MRVTSKKAGVLVAHPEPVMRLGLACLINGHGQLQVCAEAATAAATRTLCERHLPQVVVVDPEIDGGGTALLRELARWAPQARIVVFTRKAEALSVQRVFAAGALGYVTRDDHAAELTATILCALAGQRHMAPQVASLLLDKLARGEVEMHGGAEAALSDRELQVFRLIGLGKALREVASELHVSTKTVETHRQRIKTKLNLTNGAHLQWCATQFCNRATAVVEDGAASTAMAQWLTPELRRQMVPMESFKEVPKTA